VQQLLISQHGIKRLAAHNGGEAHSLRLVSETLRMAFLQSIRFEIDNNFVCRIRKSGDRLSLLSFHLFECVDRLKSIVHICTPAPLNFFNPEEKGS
jgi:hypothetical protein